MKKNCIEVDTNLMKSLGISVAVGLGLLQHKFGSNIITKPTQLLVDALGITPTTARKIINVLLEKQYIEKIEYVDRKGYTYRFK